MNFTFLEERAIIILDYLSSEFPVGVDLYVYFADANREIFKCDYKNQKIHIKEIEDQKELLKIRELRKPRKNPYSWELGEDLYKLNDNQERKESIQLTFEHELSNFILSLRFQSVNDDNQDVFFIKFRKDMSFIGVEGSNIPLTPENKTLLANILHRSITYIIYSSEKNKKEYEVFTEKTRSRINSIKRYEDQIIRYKEKQQKDIINYVNEIIENLSDRYSVKFQLHMETIDMLKEHQGSFSKLQRVVEEAVKYAFDITPTRNSKLITVEKGYFDFDEIDIYFNQAKNNIENRNNGKKESRYDKILNMLDKIEAAISVLSQNNEKITLDKVGEIFDDKVSGAYISQFISKNSHEIYNILSKDKSIFTQARIHIKTISSLLVDKSLSSKSA